MKTNSNQELLWFPEVSNFNEFCGVLCSHLNFKNTSPGEKYSVRRAFRKAVTIYYRICKAKLYMRPQYQDQPISIPQQKWQYNNREIKRLFNKWRNEPIGRNARGRGTG